MRSPHQRLRFLGAVIVLALIHLAAALSHAAEKDTWSGVPRIVATGDVHGDYKQFVRTLLAAGIIDPQNEWAGGETHLVQTGDIPDRGPDSRKAMDLLMRLEKQAKRAKGFVHALIGNHEAMNLYGDLRYVHPGEYEAFRQSGSGEVRDAFYKTHVETLQSNPGPGGPPAFNASYRERWDRQFPLGFFEHRLQFAPEGKYGRWVRKHDTVVKINDILFLHGGIGPDYVPLTIPEINDRARGELADFNKLIGGLVLDAQGPLWYRGLAQNETESEGPHLRALLDRHGAKRIVMGHTSIAKAVMPRFGGRAIFIDVGISAFYGGPLACLLIEGDELFAIHRGEKIPLPTTDSPEDLLAYLQKAAALDPSPSPLAKNIEKQKEELRKAKGSSEGPSARSGRGARATGGVVR